MAPCCISRNQPKISKDASCLSTDCLTCSNSCQFDFKRPCSSQCIYLNSTSINDQLCTEKCNFLKQRNNHKKSGLCSSVRQGFELAEVAACSKDSECPGPEKCCSNEKLKTCRLPQYIFNSSYPPVPIGIKLKKIKTSLSVSWRFNSTWNKSTVFIVEKRQSSTLFRPSNGDFAFWKFAGETADMKMIVKDLVPEEWYQIRVIAYSLNGTNGYSEPTRSIRMDVTIRRPSRPRNFTTLGAWYQNNKIYVNLSWQPPLILDLPVRRYRIIYYKDVHGTAEHYVEIPLKRKKVPGHQTSATLTDLEPNSAYIVKVQAMLAVGRGKKIRGKWDLLHLKIPSIETVTRKRTRKPIIATSKPTTAIVTDFTVELKCLRVFYSKDGALAAIVRWKVPDIVVGIQFDYHPKDCAGELRSRGRKTILLNAKEKELTLIDLYEDCHYLLKMKTYFSNNSEAPFQESLYFSTYHANVKTTEKTLASVFRGLNSNRASRLGFSLYVFTFHLLFLICNLVVIL